MARGQVIQFSAKPADTHAAVLQDELQRVVGRIVAHATIPLHQNYAGTTITLGGAGTATAAAMASAVDFADAGMDLVRAVVYGTPPAGKVTVNVRNLTTGKIVATAALPGGAAAGVFTGPWMHLTPAGGDEHLQVELVGTAGHQPVLNTVHLQGATANAKP